MQLSVAFTLCNVIVFSSVKSYNIDISSPTILFSSILQKEETFFGFSVTFWESKEDPRNSRILVGAPLDSASKDYRIKDVKTGALFSCSFRSSDQSCIKITVDVQEVRRNNLEYEADLNSSFIGVDVDVIEDYSNPIAVTCGHRWMNTKYVKENQALFINGACYWQPMTDIYSYPRKTWHKFIPLTNLGYQNLPDDIDPSKFSYYYSMGQAGTSVHVRNDGKVYIGAPGILDWTGSVIETVKVFRPENQRKKKALNEESLFNIAPIVPRPPQELNKHSYLGFAIGSGKFRNGVQRIVVGAPRANHIGKVLVMRDSDNLVDASTGLNYQMKVDSVFSGSQIGCGFGYAVAVTDLSGDGIDEIIIGAPFYARDNKLVDSGGIWVYKSMKNRKEFKLHSIILGHEESSRFGFSIAAIGDIDRDGYNDIAVGAPFEDAGRGAIYIYRGSVDGLISRTSQKISGTQLSDSIRGLGYSFSSKKSDVNGDKTPDIIAGAPFSNNVVVLLGRKIIKIDTQLKSEPTSVAKPGECFQIISCITYSGFKLPPTIEFKVTIFLNVLYGRSRASFEKTGGSTVTFSRIFVKVNESTCVEEEACLKSYRFDTSEPIEIRSTYASKSISKTTDKCPYCFVLLPSSSLQSKYKMELTSECYKSQSCSPVLTIESKIIGQNETYVLGSKETLKLRIHLTVFEDVAYGSWVNIELPKGILVRSMPYACSFARMMNENKISISCHLKSPLMVGEDVLMEIFLEENPLSYDLSTLKLRQVSIDISSGAIGAVTLKTQAVIPIVMDVDLNIFGSSDPQLLFPTQNSTFISTAFIFQLLNKGQSPLIGTEVLFWFPSAYVQRNDSIVDFLTVSSVQVNSEDTICHSIKCQSKNWQDSQVTTAQSNGDLHLKCDNDDQVVICSCISCIIGHLAMEEIYVNTDIDWTGASNLLHKNKTIEISVKGTVISLQPKMLQNLRPKPVDVSVMVVPDDWLNSVDKMDTIPYWIYLLASLGGLLILGIISGVLYKMNFFHRKLPPSPNDLTVNEDEQPCSNAAAAEDESEE